MTIQANFPAIKPSLMLDFANTKQLDSRITYTRASTASYYDGVTTSMAEQNLLTYSEQFDNAAYGKDNITITANATTSPDGNTTAEQMAETATTGLHHLSQDKANVWVASSTYVISCYAKNVDATYINLVLRGTTGNIANVEFNVSTGAVNRTNALGTGFSVVSSSITSVGNSWYRCVAVINTGTNVSAGTLYIGLSDGTTAFDTNGRVSYTGTSKSIYIWGAQAEQRSSVTAYTATTTQAITNYIPKLQSAASGVARFDNNPTTGESLGLLIEESRTNLFTYSEDASNAAWTKLDTTVVTNTIVAPDGMLTGDKLVENTSNTVHAFYQSSSFTASTTYTASFYLKASGRTIADVAFQTTLLSGGSASFDLSAGTVTSQGANATARITSVGNGWYRCSTTVTAANTVSAQVQIILRDAGGNSSYTGNGFAGLFIWGGQVEAGAFATSYIPTVASQVTRAADVASMTGTNFSSWYNAGEGTLYADAIADPSSSAASRIIDFTGSATTTQIDIYRNTGNVFGYVQLEGSNQANITIGSVSANASFKVAFSYKINDIAGSRNGAAVVTDTSAGIPTNIDRVFIGSLAGTYQWCNSTIKKIAYYPLRLSNTNLVALTS